MAKKIRGTNRQQHGASMPSSVRQLFLTGAGADRIDEAQLIKLWVTHGSEFCRAGLFVRGCWIMNQDAALFRVPGQVWPADQRQQG